MEVVHDFFVSSRCSCKLSIRDGATEVIEDSDVMRVFMRVDTGHECFWLGSTLREGRC